MFAKSLFILEKEQRLLLRLSVRIMQANVAHISLGMMRKYQSVCVSPAGTNVFACVVTACGMRETQSPGEDEGGGAAGGVLTDWL